MDEQLRLLFDEDTMNRALVNGLRARGVDVLTVEAVGRRGLPDPDQLSYATSEKCVIFTFNTRDFAKLHSELLMRGEAHAGIIVSDQLPVGTLMRRLLNLIAARSPHQMQNQLIFLSQWR